MAILNDDRLGAYAWPRRHVFVTRGMALQLPHDELAAALAHEIGHLIDDGHITRPQSLTGAAGGDSRDAEARADAIACELLASAGVEPGAMTRLLARMHTDATLSPRVQAHVAWRWQRLARASE